MSESRKHQNDRLVTPPDQLPGEAELSELYQEQANEQPSVVLDQLILNEARKVAKQRSPRRFTSRNWTVPLALAAGLLMTIGFVTRFAGHIGSPPIDEQKSATPKPSLVDQYKQANKDSREPGIAASPGQLGESLLSSQAATSSQTQEMGQSSKYTRFGSGLVQQELIPPSPTEARTKRMSETQSRQQQEEESGTLSTLKESSDPNLSIRGPFTDMSATMSSRSRQRKRQSAPASSRRDVPGVLALHLEKSTLESPNRWLNEIIDLFRSGSRNEADKSFQAFRERYPGFDNFPEDFPWELLDQVPAETKSSKR